MKYISAPKTVLGKWSIGLIVAIFLGWILLYISIGPDPGSWNFVYIATIVSGIISLGAILAGITGIRKYKERSVFVFIFTILGICIFILMLWTIRDIILYGV
jgi:hypothetical protein